MAFVPTRFDSAGRPLSDDGRWVWNGRDWVPVAIWSVPRQDADPVPPRPDPRPVAQSGPQVVFGPSGASSNTGALTWLHVIRVALVSMFATGAVFAIVASVVTIFATRVALGDVLDGLHVASQSLGDGTLASSGPSLGWVPWVTIVCGTLLGGAVVGSALALAGTSRPYIGGLVTSGVSGLVGYLILSASAKTLAKGVAAFTFTHETLPVLTAVLIVLVVAAIPAALAAGWTAWKR